MELKQRLYIQAVLVFSLFSLCFAEVNNDDFIQFYIKAPQSASFTRGADITIYALNRQGLIAKDYQGLKEVSFQVAEEGGSITASYLPLPETLDFKEGSANFSIKDSEAETLKIIVKEAHRASPFPAVIIFKPAQEPVSFRIDLDKKGVIGKPKEGIVSALDKEGAVVYEYNAGGIPIIVEESGVQDNSFSLGPQELAFKDGSAKFSITGSEEKETLAVKVADPVGKLKATEAGIIFDVEDLTPPEILEVKMETLAFVEMTFSEELEAISAEDLYNYEVVCLSTQRPRNIEVHKDKVVLELDELLKPYEQMYVAVKNIKDLAGNAIASGTRSPSYAVPKLPIRLELEVSTATPAANTSVNIKITARCISGRTPQFINGRFTISVSETVSDNSFTLSPQSVPMTKGIGEFSISNSTVERLTITVRDPDGIADPGTLELNFI